MGSYVGYRVYGYFHYRSTLIADPSLWILQIAGPPQGTSSFSYLGKVIHHFPRFELFSSSQRGGGWYLVSVSTLWTIGVGCPQPCPLSIETPLTNPLSLGIYSLNLRTTDCHHNICRGMPFSYKGPWIYQTGKMQPFQRWTPIRIHQSLTLVLSYRCHGIHNNPRRRISRRIYVLEYFRCMYHNLLIIISLTLLPSGWYFTGFRIMVRHPCIW